MEESIFINEELQGFDHVEDELLLLSTSSPEHVPASALEVAAPLSYLRGRSSPSRELPLTFRRHIHLNKS
jgi:hypothetical protein